MAHELTRNAITGLVEHAYRADHGTPWHGLGQPMPAGASIDDWIEKAGMGWSVERSPALFQTPAGLVQVNEKSVLHRSDNFLPLGVAGPGYIPTNPNQMLSFFQNILKEDGLEVSAAGTLQGGRKFWATAKFGSAQVVPGDEVGGFLQISSSADGTLATTIRRTSTRTVCRNTLRMSFQDKATLTVSHRSELDFEKIHSFLGFNQTAWDTFLGSVRKLAETPVAMGEVEEILVPILRTRDTMTEDEIRKSYGYRSVLDLFYGSGLGSRIDGVRGTRWGLLNSITEFVDHHSRSASDDSRLVSSQFGQGAAVKSRALELLSV